MRYASLIFILLFSFAFNTLKSNNPAFELANAAYAKGDYEKAAGLYEQLLSGNEVSAEVYYNLGNAYYKSGKLGLAILNYERARKIAPEDEDILANLKLANQKTEDKIEAAPQLFLTEWKSSITGLMSERAWSVCCILLFVFAALLFAVYTISSRSGVKKAGFYMGSLFVLGGIFVFFISKQKFEADRSS
jgi:tetratricopeptide (TPR) repeat protein